MQDSLTGQLTQIIRESIDGLIEDAEIEIKPSLIAAKVIDGLDPEHDSPELIAWAGNLQCRQLARAELRRYQEESEELMETQEDMFGYALQERYPVTRNCEPAYIPRDKMTQDEIAENVMRLRHESERKMAHADALEAWGKSRDETRKAQAENRMATANALAEVAE